MTAEKKSSTKEICIITPAEKPINDERYVRFKSFMKKASRLPTPVDIPAIKEKRKPIRIMLVSIMTPAFQILILFNNLRFNN